MKKYFYPRDRRELEEIIEKRNRSFGGGDERLAEVGEIIERVREEGERALYEYTERFDGVDRQKLGDLRVSRAEVEQACRQVEPEFLDDIELAAENIREYHRKELSRSWFSCEEGGMTGQLLNPLKRIGAYVPGGTAIYPSSVLMTVVPARTAGVEEVVLVSPPDRQGKISPYILAAAAAAGVDEVYKLGGAQAVAALAYGCESIRPVDKIVGPGNIYVTLAKKLVFGAVDIDMLAGPSEILILADETARAGLTAADLLSQAEHDRLSVPILITTSTQLAEESCLELEKQLAGLEREETARFSLDNYGLMVVVDTIEEGFELANRFAPEHLELMVAEPLDHLSRVRNAGAVFIGPYSPEPLGDYLAGPSHVLPTGGSARFASPLSTADFLKKTSLIYYRQDGLEKAAGSICRLAKMEGLTAHARAVEERFRLDNDKKAGGR